MICRIEVRYQSQIFGTNWLIWGLGQFCSRSNARFHSKVVLPLLLKCKWGTSLFYFTQGEFTRTTENIIRLR